VLSLRKNIQWTFVGNVIYSGCQWALLVTIAKTLGVEDLGRFSLAIAIVSPVFAFSNVNLRAVQATDVTEKFSFTEYLYFRLLCSSIALLIVGATTQIFSYASDLALIVIAYAFVKYIESISDVLFGLFQKHENMRAISTSLIIRGVINLMLFSCLIVLTEQLVYAVVSMVFVTVILLLVKEVPLGRLLGGGRLIRMENGSVSFLKVLAILTLPLGFTIFANVAYQHVPKLFVEFYFDTSELGIFAGISYFIIIGSTVVNALGQSATPRLAKYYRNDMSAFKILMFRLAIMSLCVGIVGVVVAYVMGDWILGVIYSNEFVGHGDIFVWVMVAALFTYVSGIVGSGLTSMHKFNCQAKISLVCLASMLFMSWMLINDYGLQGAAWAMAISYIIKLSMEVYYLVTEIIARECEINCKTQIR
jgi:O-antigen/teichoic acid export membrane protein